MAIPLNTIVGQISERQENKRMDYPLPIGVKDFY
jgi:hypothetical protein